MSFSIGGRHFPLVQLIEVELDGNVLRYTQMQ